MTEPTYLLLPDGDESAGQDAVDLAAAYGVPLDPWQADIVRGILREREGIPVASQAGLLVSRQSGKGRIALVIELYRLFVTGDSILATAHSVKTSSDAFRRLWAVIQSHEDLSRRVRRHSQMIGAEFIELDTGARIAFSTRSASSGRGIACDLLVLDESQDMPSSEIAALQPTTFSRPRSQVLLLGTAPGPQNDAESFAAIRRAAHDKLNPKLYWAEYCSEWNDPIDDEKIWLRCNPAVATGRVSIDAIRNDRNVLPPDMFRCERLSAWIPAGAADAVFDPAQWDSLADTDSAPVKDLAVGVDAHPSRSSATVCIAGRRQDGRIHVEWYESSDGVTWLPGWVAARLDRGVRAVVVDGGGVLAELDWAGSRVRPTLVGVREVATACGLFWDAVTEGSLRHRQQVELSKGVLGAKQRPMLGGQAFGWDRKAAGSSVLIAATLAVWGVQCERPLRPKRGDGQRRAALLM
jgi:hypothetical protein